jgi:hypothetical protein
MNSAMFGTRRASDARCARAMSEWVLPPPYWVSSRKMALASPPFPLSREMFSRSCFRPSVGWVLAKKMAGS